jgi:signal transduction histidine kinase
MNAARRTAAPQTHEESMFMEGTMKEVSAGDGEIMIVEDSPTQAFHLQYLLEKHGFRVTTAASGREALARMSGKRPSIVISDVVMPEMDGFELCRRIKADDSLCHIPVILLTSLSEPQNVIRGLECGADNFITKPCDEEYLLSRLGRMRASRERCPPADGGTGVDVNFAGHGYTITADRRHILEFLLSTYETAMQKNRELIQARDELNALNEHLAATNRELETFNYTVSHDLRTPLTGITGFSQLLLEMFADRFDAECASYIQEILQSARRMNQLIETLLNFSRLTRIEPERQPVDLSLMARSVAAELNRKEPQRHVTFRIGEGITAYGDTKLLKVVLENLLGNAWKYTGREEDARIEFGMLEHGGTPAYFVRDNGAGFDAAKAEMLFMPFKRLHETDEFEGTGIGLATVQRIIERHGGRAWADGEMGQGATFYFTLERQK